jgi:acetolactate synthase I/III small subunit
VIVDNESGVLARVIGLFSGRGYNIDSLTVAEVDHTGPPQPHHHRHHAARRR